MALRNTSANSYDPACHDLAAAFLVDHPDKNTPENIDQLAALIQRTIEDDIEFGMKPKFSGGTCSGGDRAGI